MEKFKTVNNWVCKHFIIALSNGNYRQCSFLAYNTFDECLSSIVKSRMLKYFFDSISESTLDSLTKCLPFDVLSYMQHEFRKYNNIKTN